MLTVQLVNECSNPKNKHNSLESC